MKPWANKGWLQWLFAVVFFLTFSWLYMGSAINDCSTSTTAFASDSTGGLVWFQWVDGNDLSWDYSDKSNFPYGESLVRPQFITSSLYIFVYKLFASISSPVCGLNLMVLLGYMSTALTMFGLVKWLFKRTEIALFAGYAAAFVPYHQLKAESHVVYIYGSIFIAIIWAYLWFLGKPSYKKAALFSLISATGFYFDGYFVLITAIITGTLYISSFFFDLARLTSRRGEPKAIIKESRARFKYLAVSILLLGLLLLPILHVYKSQGATIRQSLASARSDIKIETITYGARPIEFILPAFNNPLMPDKYLAWRLTEKNQHFSNPSETTLYLGWTVILLALASATYLFSLKARRIKFNGISYSYLLVLVVLVLLMCFSFSLPSKVLLVGHHFPTPTLLLAEVTATWRVLARLFLAIDPLVVILASTGMYMITKGRRRVWQLLFASLCMLILFFEYLPAQLGYTGDLHKNSPGVYAYLKDDSSVAVIAEYPLTDFRNSPAIFTYQQLHDKRIVNANNSEIMKGPLHSSIAGLNDPQTLGALKKLNVDVVTTYGFDPHNDRLTQYRPNNEGTAGIYSYRIKNSVVPRNAILLIDKGYESLSVDDRQVSHRAIIGDATMRVFNISKSEVGEYRAKFSAQSLCGKSASITVTQGEKTLWSGSIGISPLEINFLATGDKDIKLRTTCSADITNMSVE